MPTRDQYAEIIKSAALSAGKKAVIASLKSRFPFFALPIVSPILGWIVTSVLTEAILQTEFGLFFSYIDMRTMQQGRDFEAAALANYRAQKFGTAQEKKNAEALLIDRFRALAKFTN